MSDRIQNHYQNIASIYDDLWFYSEYFINFFASKIIEYLNLSTTDILVDLGCGTGIYSKGILKQINLQNPIVCVDPSDNMLSKIALNSGMNPVNMDGITFSSQPGTYNRILIKEAIHHIEEKKLLFNNLLQRLANGGILLLLLLPPTIDYPLFRKALSLYEQTQPHYQDMANLLQEVGFDVAIDFVDYPLKFSKEQYLNMVKNRYMSLLSRFDDQEIAAGIAELEEKYKNKSTIEFIDSMVFIKASKA
ncbi:MAG: methyltransferase domain-containing protein [Moorea sp. SIO2B7]|nr:methyltransferase domain-containing protein [Moorena sp. SIO2B7]